MPQLICLAALLDCVGIFNFQQSKLENQWRQTRRNRAFNVAEAWKYWKCSHYDNLMHVIIENHNNIFMALRGDFNKMRYDMLLGSLLAGERCCWCRCRIIIVITETHSFYQHIESANNSRQFIILAFVYQTNAHSMSGLFANANHVRA